MIVFFNQNPQVELRVYGHYSLVCDLSFTSRMTNVRHFSADCLMDATGFQHLARMEKVESLAVGVYHLDSFEFLNQLSPKINKLSLGRTKSKKPDLSPIVRFADLEKIYLDGQQKNIEVLEHLKNLNEVVLRSISTPNVSYLKPLHRLQKLDIKLGGINDFSDIEEKSTIRYLELWQVRDLANLGFISNLPGLQYVFLQSLKQLIALPSFKCLNNLRRIYLENLKSLIDINSLESAPGLEEIACVGFSNRNADFWIPLLKNPHLKRASVWSNSERKTKMFSRLAEQYQVEVVQGLGEFVFI